MKDRHSWSSNEARLLFYSRQARQIAEMEFLSKEDRAHAIKSLKAATRATGDAEDSLVRFETEAERRMLLEAGWAECYYSDRALFQRPGSYVGFVHLKLNLCCTAREAVFVQKALDAAAQARETDRA